VIGLASPLVLVELGLRAWEDLAPPPREIWEYSPTRHHVLTPGVSMRHRTAEFDYVWRNNALGMRDPERTLHKPPGTYRLLFLGDSMVQGHGVALPDTIPSRLESWLAGRAGARPRVEVLNAGVFGYSPLLESIYLREVADALEPDLVLLGVTLANDVGEDAFYESRARADPNGAGLVFPNAEWPWANILQALGGGGATQSGATPEPPSVASPAAAAETSSPLLPRLKSFLSRHSRAYESARIAFRSVVPSWGWYYERCEREFALVAAHRGDIRYDVGLVNYPVLTREERMAYWERSKRYLGQIQALCRARGAPLVLVVFPPYERFDGSTEFDEPYAMLDAIGAELGVPVIQLLPAFRARDARSIYFAYDRHLRPEGTQLAASVIGDELARLGLLGAISP
jgi:hypothetical protein